MNFIEFSIKETDSFSDLDDFIFDWTKRSTNGTIVVGDRKIRRQTLKRPVLIF